VIAFYMCVATIVPVLYIAFVFQFGLTDLWRYEEPIYQSVFPVYVLIHGLVALLAEASALAALATQTDNGWTRSLSVVGVFLPLLYVVIGMYFKARDQHAEFSWAKAFAENAEHSRMLAEAKLRRREERRAMFANRRPMATQPEQGRLSVSLRPAPAAVIAVGTPALGAIAFATLASSHNPWSFLPVLVMVALAIMNFRFYVWAPRRSRSGPEGHGPTH
jgi:hypothetical protein